MIYFFILVDLRYSARMTSENNFKGPVLHVVVVGFHHKKGCQVKLKLKTDALHRQALL